jgi:hypothetical protein
VKTAPAFLDHPGIVLDSYTLHGVDAKITSYASDKGDDSLPCPKLDKSEGEFPSDPKNGLFVTRIKKELYGVTLVVCKNGYAPLTTYTPNSEEFHWVIPTPLLLYPLEPKDPIKQRDIALRSIKYQIRTMDFYLAYYRDADPVAFKEALDKLDDDHRAIVETILKYRPPREKTKR